MTRPPRLLLALCALVGSTVAATAADPPRPAPSDIVTWIDHGATKTRSGVVVEAAGFDQVVFSQSGRRTTLDGADVTEVRWGDAPPGANSATAALRDGDAEAARAGFDAVLRARATPRGWLVERGALGLAEAWLGLAARDGGGADKAAHAFGTARDANPRSLVLDRILAGLGAAELLRGKTDAALAAANDLEAAARTARRPLWTCQALLLRAKALEARGDVGGAVRAVEEAIARTDAAAAAAAKDTAQGRPLRRAAALAAVRKAWFGVAAAQSTKTDDAVERARKMVADAAARDPTDPDVEAFTTNAEGALLLLAGDAKRALRKFLETDVVHFDVPEEAARALWYQALCYERLDDKPARAEALRRLSETYPESEWARRAR